MTRLKTVKQKARTPALPPTRTPSRTGTLTERIATLEVGDSISDAKRLHVSEVDAETRTAWFDSVRGPTNTLVSRVKKQHPHRDFIVQRGEFLTADQHLVLVSVLTRTS